MNGIINTFKWVMKRIRALREIFTIPLLEEPIRENPLQELTEQLDFWQKEEKRITDQAIVALRNRSLKEAKQLIQQARVVRRRIGMEFDRNGGREARMTETEKELDQIRCNMLKRIDETIAEDPWKHQ